MTTGAARFFRLVQSGAGDNMAPESDTKSTAARKIKSRSITLSGGMQTLSSMSVFVPISSASPQRADVHVASAGLPLV
jgi:hypothetical protein